MGRNWQTEHASPQAHVRIFHWLSKSRTEAARVAGILGWEVVSEGVKLSHCCFRRLRSMILECVHVDHTALDSSFALAWMDLTSREEGCLT
jgi:hypothetical protein